MAKIDVLSLSSLNIVCLKFLIAWLFFQQCGLQNINEFRQLKNSFNVSSKVLDTNVG